ncbi:MAG TPA: hypothetical protein VF408_05405 [Sediminibacterium sp.]|jgi:hypothetical protein
MATPKSLMVLLLALACHTAFAQDNKAHYGSLGLGILMPQGKYKNNWKNGFHADFTVNAQLSKKLWFTAEFPFESVSADSSGKKSIGMLGAAPGLKFFPVNFLYIKASAGIHLNYVNNLYSGFATGYLSGGAGLWFTKDVGVFFDYNLWKAAQGGPYKRFEEYMNLGVMFGFGKK